MNKGLGDANAKLRIYVANPPLMPGFNNLQQVRALNEGEIGAIGYHCGNGWKKVFNVYAKLVFALPQHLRPELKNAACWQDYRDNLLLQADSQTSLLFSPPQFASGGEDVLHVIAGRQHARQLQSDQALSIELTWLNEAFAINERYRLVVCPFLDYRQLSNEKIVRVADLVSQFSR